ncbi:retrovirus-related Pol polyprotein from transposon 17.6 [Trichonephila clavipes]|nr:retrovirus-related Pol polyprotein from transposon 17.6 [Trichonephila clavipes]
MAFLGKGKKQDMLQLAEELGINATLNMTVPSIKIAITNSEGYEEEFVKNLYETIIANGKRLEELERAEKMRLEELERAEKMRLEELERAEKMRLEELVKEQALKEKELQLKFDLERFKIESGFRIQVKSGGLSAKICPTPEKSDSTWKDFTFEITNYLDEWLIGLEINTFQDLKDLMVVDQLKKRANASMKDHFLDNWANLKSATQIAELFDNYEDVRKGSVNGHEIDILRDTGATIDLVCAKYINPSSFSGENVWVKQPLSPELVCLPLAVVEISGNFGTVQTKAAVCGNHLNQHGRYLLGNKTAELIKGNLGYNFLPVEILNAVQTRSQVKAAREERGIDSGDAKKGKMSALTTEFFERFGILVRHSSVYHPQSNPVERFHRTLKRLLRVLCLDAGSEWDKHLPSILLALRTVSHESIGYTPSELVYGKNLRTPETLVMEHWMEPEEEGDLVTEYMFKLINRLKKMSRSSYK